MKLAGIGPSLIDATPWLRNDQLRHERILTVVEGNSVIEGLPPFSEATRHAILMRLRADSSPSPGEVLPQ